MKDALPPPRESLRELDEAIDQWNRIWCQRGSRKDRIALDSSIWKVGEERIIPYLRQELPIILKSMLAEREKELAALARLPVLTKDSNIEDYRKYVENLRDRMPVGGPSSSHVQQTEALLSLVHDLTPGLEKSLLDEMNRVETWAKAHKKAETVRHQGDVVQTIRQNNDEPDPRYFKDRDEDIDIMATTYHHDRESPILGEPAPRSRHRMDDILPSTETRTPATTPNTLDKLHQYEQAHLRNVQSVKAGQTARNQPALKRKATESAETCTPETNSKRARIEVGQSEPPNSVASTFSFPSVSRLALSMRSKTRPPLDQNAQEDTPSAASGVETIASHEGATPAKPLSRTMSHLTRSAETMSTSPQEKFIRPAAPRATEALHQNTDVTPRPKKKRAAEAEASHGRAMNRVNQNYQTINTPGPSDAIDEADATDEEASFRRFRESTEDFHAMTPSSREQMLYRAVKSMYRKPAKR